MSWCRTMGMVNTGQTQQPRWVRIVVHVVRSDAVMATVGTQDMVTTFMNGDASTSVH